MPDITTKMVTVNASGKSIAKFKAGTDLDGEINVAYIDTNGGSTDGNAYEYSVQFVIVEPVKD